MHFPEQPDEGVIDAISGMRRCMAKQLDTSEDRQACEDRFRLVERSALLGLALQSDIADDSADGVFVAEPVGDEFRWMYVNRSFAHMNGLTGHILTGEMVAALPETARFEARCRGAVLAQTPQRYADRVDRPGCQMELQTRVTPVCDSEGRCWIVGVCRDITEQRLAERQLRKQNRRLQNILGSINDGFVVVDREWQINFVNARAEQMLGAPRTQLIGTCLTSLLPEIAPGRLRAPVEFEWTPMQALGAELPEGAPSR